MLCMYACNERTSDSDPVYASFRLFTFSLVLFCLGIACEQAPKLGIRRRQRLPRNSFLILKM